VLRHAIAVAVVRGYAASGHPVILHGATARPDHEQLVAELEQAGLAPVRLVDVADGEDYGEVARRLIED
jgi:NAD(P)-dependent dehydrogenase (short-subunit alcohol dehydrogenase family)